MKRIYSLFFAAAALSAFLIALGIRTQARPASPAASGGLPTSTVAGASTVSPDAVLTGTSMPTSTQSAIPGVRAAAAMDLLTGEMLYSQNPDLRWPLASITKLMTASIVLDRMDRNADITLAPSDFAAGGSLTASLNPGESYRVDEFLKVLLLPSSNEAAEAFARTYGRGAFLAAMNAQAAAWGLAETHFSDPSGVSAANQSTPREYLAMTRQLYLLRPEIFMITQSRAATVTELSSGAAKSFPTTNNFAGRAGFLGGKTGTTPQSGDNLVSIFRIGARPVAIIVFGAGDRWAATESLIQLLNKSAQ